MNRVASQHYAFEGRSYVVAVGQTMQVKDTPSLLDLPDTLADKPDEYVLRGASCAFDPSGSMILHPIGVEDIGYIDIENFDICMKEKMNLSVSGHYQRDDVFNFDVTRTRKTD